MNGVGGDVEEILKQLAPNLGYLEELGPTGLDYLSVRVRNLTNMLSVQGLTPWVEHFRSSGSLRKGVLERGLTLKFSLHHAYDSPVEIAPALMRLV